MSGGRPKPLNRVAALPPRKGELYPNPDAMQFLLTFFGYPLNPPPFKKDNGTCYWGLGGNQKEDDDDKDVPDEPRGAGAVQGPNTAEGGTRDDAPSSFDIPRFSEWTYRGPTDSDDQ